ncbi:MAG: V-type ATP synthase subunit E [Rhabdochlamydiaceae bacterium]
MAAETLLREVEDKRKKTLDQLDADRAAKKQEIAARVDRERQSIRESARKQAQELCQREKIRIEGAAKLQAKKLIFDATEKMLEKSIVEVKRALAEYSVSSKDYPDLLIKMAKYACKRLGGEIRVMCRPGDETILKRAGVQIAASNLNSMGGFKAERTDGSLELDLTFEELLRSREEEVRSLIQSK